MELTNWTKQRVLILKKKKKTEMLKRPKLRRPNLKRKKMVMLKRPNLKRPNLKKKKMVMLKRPNPKRKKKKPSLKKRKTKKKRKDHQLKVLKPTTVIYQIRQFKLQDLQHPSIMLCLRFVKKNKFNFYKNLHLKILTQEAQL